MVPTTAAAARPDATCAAAVELAAAAARAEGAADAPEHLGLRAEGDRVVTHFFAATLPGYTGWRWAVTVARAPRSKLVTVDEVVLLPGEEALLAPEWVPWSERLRPGDLGVGDLVPTPEDDDRLVPAYLLSDDPMIESVAFELGLGRRRVMSLLGRDDAADRWNSGEGGPDTPMAAQAPGRCGGCGFYLPIKGSLGLVFGVCGNALSPRDGGVVSIDAGCGAHSEALPEPPPLLSPPPAPAYDDGDDIEAHLPAPAPDSPPPAAGTGESVGTGESAGAGESIGTGEVARAIEAAGVGESVGTGESIGVSEAVGASESVRATESAGCGESAGAGAVAGPGGDGAGTGVG